MGVKERPQCRPLTLHWELGLLTAPLLSLAGPLCASWVQGGAGAPWPGIFPEQGSSQGSTFPALASATNQRHTSPLPQVTPRPPGMTWGGGASGAGGTHQPSPQASPEMTGPTHDFRPKGSRPLSCSTRRKQSPFRKGGGGAPTSFFLGILLTEWARGCSLRDSAHKVFIVGS